MKFTMKWLKTFLDTDATLQEVTTRLTELGIEVEDVIDRSKEFDGYVVGYVETCTKHPDADKLNVTMVDTGTEKLQVVCGAPNCHQGMKGVFAPAGTYVPGIDMTLKQVQIRGVESNGMLCSEKELCLSDEHKGIIELPQDAEIGAPAAKVLGLDDPVIEIEVTPNRPDTTGVYGIARDLAASGMGTLKSPDFSAVDSAFETDINIHIDDAAKQACPLFLGRKIKSLKNTESPQWLKDRLKAVGLRPISALVDITNYMTLSFARPLHVYDTKKLNGDIHVKLTKGGETLEALNDKTYEDIPSGYVGIYDEKSLLGLGGIVGGEGSSVDEDTTDIILECAYFDPAVIAKAGRGLNIITDARYRFERGIDPEFIFAGMEFATRMILEVCGGDAGSVEKAGDAPDQRVTVSYDPKRVETLGGIKVDNARQKEILTALGFNVDDASSPWQVTAPHWRPDIDADGRADLVEEVLRVYGYDNIPAVSLPRPALNSGSPLTVTQQRAAKLRRLMSGRGLNETVTWSFMDRDTAMLFGANDKGAADQLQLTNPISSDLDQMRPSILPNLLRYAQKNTDKALPDAAFFEIGHVYHDQTADGQILLASGLRTGAAEERHWSNPARDVDFYDVKADVFAVCEAFGLDASRLPLTDEVPAWYHPGRAASLRLGRNVLACFGALHPGVLKDMGIKTPAVGFEIFVEQIPVPKNKSNAFKVIELHDLQPVNRDFAFITKEEVKAEDIIRAVSSADKNLIVHVDVFDVYQGKGVEDGHKSIAVNVVLQPAKDTLTEKDLEGVSKKIVDQVAKKTGATLRG